MMNDVAKFIHEVGMSPSEFADELGLPRGQVSRLIVGEEEPDRLTRWALAGLRAARVGGGNPILPTGGKKPPTNPLAGELADDTWTGQTARLALPILIETATDGNREPITYSQLHDKVAACGGKKDIGKMTKYAFPLGRIASAVERLGFPPLTTIVVKGTTGLPSSGIGGFIINYLDLNRDRAKALNEDLEVRRQIVKRLWNEVFDYEEWPAAMVALGITGDPSYDL